MKEITPETIITGRMVIQNIGNIEFDTTRDFLMILVSDFKELYEKKGLYEITEECEKSQLSGIFDDITIYTASSAGRRLFTLRRQNLEFTFICADGEIDSGMGWQGFNGILPDLEKLVKDFIEKWNNLEISQIKDIYKYDAPLSII